MPSIPFTKSKIHTEPKINAFTMSEEASFEELFGDLIEENKDETTDGISEKQREEAAKDFEELFADVGKTEG